MIAIAVARYNSSHRTAGGRAAAPVKCACDFWKKRNIEYETSPHG
jgi:hypothetical protein